VDPTGQHVYVSDERNPFIGRTIAGIYEFDASTVERDIVYVSGPLTAGSHTFQVTNPSGSPIALDGFVVLG
jgi:hypothetical protein